MCHEQEYTPGGLEEDCVTGPLVSCLVLVRGEGLQVNSWGRTLTVTDHLLLAPKALHNVTSSATVAWNSLTTLVVI